MTNYNAETPVNDKYLFSHSGELEALQQALQGRQLSGTSSVIDAFEAELAEHFGAKHAVALNSGTASLHAALFAAGVVSGSEVILPATSPVPTGLPLLTAGATPVFVDTKPDGVSMDPESLERAISPNTRAAISLPLWGYPVEDGEMREILENRGVALIEDAAQAHGTLNRGLPSGRVGSIGCFSTHDRKLLSTGEGGFVLTDDGEIAERIRKFAQLGGLDGKTYGVNYKLGTLSAALGRFRLQFLQSQIQARRTRAEYILRSVEGSFFTELSIPSDSMPNYYSLVLVPNVAPEAVADIKAYLVSRGIVPDSVKYGYTVLYRRSLFSRWAKHCNNAERLAEITIQLPVHPGLSQSELDHISETLSECVTKFSS